MSKYDPQTSNPYYLNGISSGADLDDALMLILGRAKSLNGTVNGVNYQTPKWNIYNPKSVYKHTNGLGNCTVVRSFGGIPLRLPAWHYANEDNEWGTGANYDSNGNVEYSIPSGVSSGTGVLTPETYNGRHLYKDLASGNYFYVVHHSPKHGHNPQSGLESVYYQKKYPNATIPDRAHEDAVIGSDDEWTKKYDPTFGNTCIVGVPNPHLSKADFMRIVYPSYDDPMQRALALTNNPTTFLNETVDTAKYTPYQELSSLISTAGYKGNAGSAEEKGLTSGIKQSEKTLGRDVQPLDPNFHIFRPVNMLAIRTHPDMAAANIIGLSGGKYGHLQAWKLVQAYLEQGQNYSCGVGGGLPSSTYYSILQNVSPYLNLPASPSDPDYSRYKDVYGHLVDYVALAIATGKSSFASTPMTKLNALAPYQTSLSGYMFSRQYRYEALLFDMYADNSKYFSGKFDVTGRLGIEYGIRLLFYDERRQYVWEFYVDGVGQSWSANGTNPQPWVTTISVERGLPFTMAEAKDNWKDPVNNKNYIYQYDVPTVEGTINHRTGKNIIGDFSKRFTGGYWGRQSVFTGGFFGEQTLSSMINQANLRNKAYMSRFGNSGSSAPSKSHAKSSSSSDIVSFAKKYIGLPYVLGGDSHDVEEGKPKSKCSGTDCNKFAWAVVTHCGYKGGPYPGNCDDSISNLSKYEVPESKTHAGSLIICEAHAMIMEEKGHGNGTKIINETKGAAGDHVMETTVGPEMEGVSRANWHYFNLPKK